jgi:hypothetical protein
MSDASAGSPDATRTTCPVCAGPVGQPFVRITQQPVHCNLLWGTRAEARAAVRGDIALAFCHDCGHVHNAEFDARATAYGGTYENSLHHSAVFQGYAEGLVADLVERHGLRGIDIVEIGAGQGDFLQMMCVAGGNRGTGFDPSFVGETDPGSAVSVVPAYYGEEFADHPADVIISRHVLEHIEEAGEFIEMLRRVVGTRDTLVFFEVPNAVRTLEDGGIWDVIYEHCGYFTPPSFSEVFRRAGFSVGRTETVFGGQFLTLEARPVDDIEPRPTDHERRVEGIAQAVDAFSATYERSVDHWRGWISDLAELGDPAVIWGAGSKGVSFLNTVDPDGTIESAVDINERKRGQHIAGTGQRIVGPDELVNIRPAKVIVMNPNYRGEIEARLRELGLDAEVVVA